MRTQMSLENYPTQITLSLPFCLYRVDDRYFNVADGFNTQIRFIKEKIEPSRRTGRSVNMEFIRDRWGTDAFSRVEINTSKIFSDDLGSKQARIFCLNLINDFIRLYRLADPAAIHLITLVDEDIHDFHEKKANGLHSVSISLGGGVTQIDHKKIAQISELITKALEQKYQIPLWKELLFKAEHYIFVGDTRVSLLESVIALEDVLSRFIRHQCKARNISDIDANEFIKNVGLTGSIKTTLKLLTDITSLDENVLDKCTGGITIRNAVVHKGREQVSLKEAQDTLGAVRAMITFLQKSDPSFVIETEITS